MPPRSILWPLLFLIFIHHIVNSIDSNIRVFADDIRCLFTIENAPYAAICINEIEI